jgi:hypothetical protein
VRAVMLAGSAGDNFADEFVPPVHADAELVAVVAFAVFLGMGGVQGLLPALGLAPVFGGLALCKLLSLSLASLVKCWMGAGTRVASMICPQRAMNPWRSSSPSTARNSAVTPSTPRRCW